MHSTSAVGSSCGLAFGRLDFWVYPCMLIEFAALI